MSELFGTETITIYGTVPTNTTILGVQSTTFQQLTAPTSSSSIISSATTIEEVQEIYRALIQTIEIFQTMIEELQAGGGSGGTGPSFAITPQMSFGNISTTFSYAHMISRNIYYTSGNTNLPPGSVLEDGTNVSNSIDYRILYTIYQESPYLQDYDFVASEPLSWFTPP